MSWKRGQKAGRGKKSSWSGGDSQDTPRHRWQDAAGSSEVDRTRRRRSRNRWAVTTVMALALLSMLIVLLLYLKPRTPFVVITATNYEVPVPINAWAMEDREAFKELDGANLILPKHLPDWDESDGRFELFPKSFDLNAYRSVVPLVVYISAHGVVNNEGKPCVLPPGVSIDQPKRWIPVADLLDEISEKTQSKRDALLVLDCNRIRANWNLGIIYNTFAERVKDVVNEKKKKLPRLAVLMSAGPGQVNWASAELRGSVFARYLQLGLAGAADEQVIGNGDHNVSLKELASYLKHEVSAWSQFNRGEPQEPMLVPEDAEDFHVTYSSSAQGYLVKKFQNAARANSHESANKDEDLWSKLDDLRNRGLVRCDPIACSRFEHALLRLEELTLGGKEYEKAAEKLRAKVEEQLKNAADRARAISASSNCAADYYGLTGDASWLRISNVGFNLPACEYFGLCDDKQAKKVREVLVKLINTRTQEAANAIVGSSRVTKLAENLSETQFFAALGQQQVNSLSWGSLLPDVLELRTTAEKLAVPCVTEAEPTDKKSQPSESDQKSNGEKTQPHAPKRELGDERAHYFARFALEKADARRRLVEDLLFVGRQNAPKQFDRAVQDTKGLYDWASKVMKDASTAFRARDDAFARGPYLAQWLCDPLSAGLPDREKLVTKLIPLIHGAHKLSAEINDIQVLQNSSYLESGADLPFSAQSKQVQDNLQAIQENGFDNDLVKLVNLDIEVADASNWRHLEAAMQTPLVPSSARKDLLKKRADLSGKLNKEFIEEEHKKDDKAESGKEKASPAPHSDRKPNDSLLETVQQLNAHPLFEILQVDGPAIEKTGDFSDWSDKANVAVRRGLKEHVATKGEKKKSAESQQDDTIASVRLRYSAAEAERRAKSALINEPSEEKAAADETVDKLRRFDIQQLLIWNGQRAIKDFWLNTLKPIPSSPFFLLSATDLFQEASGLIDPPISAVNEQIKRSKPQSSGGTEGLPIFASADPLQSNEKAAVVSVVIGENSKRAQYPTGFAPVYLLDETRRLVNLSLQSDSPDHTRYADVSSIGDKVQRFTANIANTSNFGTSLKAVTFFRGRKSEMGFRIPNTTGVAVDYVPHVYKDQSITLNGKRLQRSSIDFILDCSKSMEDKTARTGEVTDAGRKVQRLGLAKEQVKIMLDDLVARNKQNEELEEIYLGMRFIGHRVSWIDGIIEKGMYVNPAYQKDEQHLRQVRPSRDIEVALTLGKFDDTNNEAIKSRITALEPWGETPLYRALKEALADFQSESSDSRKCIIAITDGMNFQAEPDTRAQDVLDMWQNHQVPIYILGFDIASGEKAETEQATREYTAIAKATHGKFLPVNNGSELLAKLKETLPIDLYSVSDSGRPPTKLNDPTSIDKSKLPKDFTVSIRSISKSVNLEGGEAIALYMSENSQNIEAWPYSRDIPPVYLQGGPNRKPIGLRVHRPDKLKDLVHFKISLQADPKTDHFTGRPLETWVEITPLANSASAGPPYVFYDVNFEPHEPVPVLKWTAPNWPEGADQARIRFWCKYARTDAVQSIKLSDLLKSKQSIAGAEFSATLSNDGNQCAIQIEELHGPQSPIDEFRVGFETDIVEKPRRVIHRFNSKLGVATHSYFFPAELRENIERSEKSRVVVTRGKDMKEGAFQLPPDGLTVSVSVGADVFPQSATSTGR